MGLIDTLEISKNMFSCPRHGMQSMRFLSGQWFCERCRYDEMMREYA